MERIYIVYCIKSTVFITFSVDQCFNCFWRINITGCVIRNSADDLAEWRFGSGQRQNKKKKISCRARITLAHGRGIDNNNKEIKHDVIRQMANASLPFILLPFYRILK